MKQVVLALVVLAAGAVALGADDEQAKKDLKALQGTWEYSKHVSNGKDTSKDRLEGLTLTIKDGKWEVKKDDVVFLAGTVKLDASKKPRAADWTITSDGELKDKTLLSVYKIDKDSFEHCWGMESRPEKFESKEDSQFTHTTFTRPKKKKD